MRLVVVESPYAASDQHSVLDHVTYARACMADCLRRGEAPIASHLIYTQPGILDDNVPAERILGINAGFAWAKHAEAHVFYTDLGWSRGMLAARSWCEAQPKRIEFRSLGRGW